MREGSGEDIRIGYFHSVLACQLLPHVVAAQHVHFQVLGIIGGNEVVHHPVHEFALRRQDRRLPPASRGCLRVAEAQPSRIQQREVGRSPRLRVFAMKHLPLARLQVRSAQPEVGRHAPQVRHQGCVIEKRPRPVEGRLQLRALAQSPAPHGLRHIVLAQLVRQDIEQRIPDIVPGFIVRRTGLGRVKSLRPIVAAQPNIGIGVSTSMPSVGGSS